MTSPGPSQAKQEHITHLPQCLEIVQRIIETHSTAGYARPPGQNITSSGKWKWIFVSFTLKIKILLKQEKPFSSAAGQLVTKVKMNTPFPPTGIVFGFTSTSPYPWLSIPTNSASSVNDRFSVFLKASFTSLLLLFLTIPSLIILVPYSLTSSLLHTISGILAVCSNITLSTLLAPSKVMSSLALIAQLAMKGVLTPTTKLQTPFCMALNLNSSKYSNEFSLRMPKMNSGMSVSV